jgi:hypothetical protein
VCWKAQADGLDFALVYFGVLETIRSQELQLSNSGAAGKYSHRPVSSTQTILFFAPSQRVLSPKTWFPPFGVIKLITW